MGGITPSSEWQGDSSHDRVREGFLEEEHLNAICRANQAKGAHKFILLVR